MISNVARGRLPGVGALLFVGLVGGAAWLSARERILEAEARAEAALALAAAAVDAARLAAAGRPDLDRSTRVALLREVIAVDRAPGWSSLALDLLGEPLPWLTVSGDDVDLGAAGTAAIIRRDRELIRWDLTRGRPTGSHRFADPIREVLADPDASQVLVATRTRDLLLWDAVHDTVTALGRWVGRDPWVLQDSRLWFSADRSTQATIMGGARSLMVSRQQAGTWAPELLLPGLDRVRGVVIGASTLLVDAQPAGGASRQLLVFPRASVSPAVHWGAAAGGPRKLLRSPEGRWAAALSEGGELGVWNLGSGLRWAWSAQGVSDAFAIEDALVLVHADGLVRARAGLDGAVRAEWRPPPRQTLTDVPISAAPTAELLLLPWEGRRGKACITAIQVQEMRSLPFEGAPAGCLAVRRGRAIRADLVQTWGPEGLWRRAGDLLVPVAASEQGWLGGDGAGERELSPLVLGPGARLYQVSEQRLVSASDLDTTPASVLEWISGLEALISDPAERAVAVVGPGAQSLFSLPDWRPLLPLLPRREGQLPSFSGDGDRVLLPQPGGGAAIWELGGHTERPSLTLGDAAVAVLVGDRALSVSETGAARLTALDRPAVALRDDLWRASRLCLPVDERMGLLGEHEEDAVRRYCLCNACYGDTPEQCVGRETGPRAMALVPECPATAH